MESSSCDKMGYENTRVRIITVTWSRQLCAIVAVGANTFDGCIAPWLLLPPCRRCRNTLTCHYVFASRSPSPQWFHTIDGLM